MDSDRFSGQYSNPEGAGGRMVLERMNEHHVPLWDEMLMRLPPVMDGAVLDVGCGGGGLLARLAERYPYAMLTGVDVSEDALGYTRAVNSGLAEEGRLELLMASVDDLPFGDGSFDLVTASETYFFWPDLGAGLGEISRVLSPGGVLAVASELTYATTPEDVMEAKCREYGMRIVRDGEMMVLFDSVGLDGEVHVVGPGVVYVGMKRL